MFYDIIISIESDDELEPEELDTLTETLEDKANELDFNINEAYWEEN